jgi:hypothetical protein
MNFIRVYFQEKRRQLLSQSAQAVTDHNGLRGHHRESVVKLYLDDVLPTAFKVGTRSRFGHVIHSEARWGEPRHMCSYGSDSATT